jgi:integrase
LRTPGGLNAVRAIIREELAGLAGKTIDQPAFDAGSLREIVASEVKAGVRAADRDRWSAELLSSHIEAYLSPDRKRKEVRLKHSEDVSRRLRNFLAFVGDQPVRDITREHLKSYRDKLDQLPDRYAARLRTRDMREAIEKNKLRKKPIPHIGKVTVDLKWLGPVIRFFDWMVREEKVEKNPCDGIRSNQADSQSAASKRLPFKPEQISRIFAVTSAHSRATAMYWLPLLLLCTGARPNELCQLQTGDLQIYNGSPHLSVLCLPDEDEKQARPIDMDAEKLKDLHVKSAAARRMIPVHPILIKAGFLEFVQERSFGKSKQLFKELYPNRHGYWSAAITKRLNRIIRKELQITNRKYTLYSFRHYFKDAYEQSAMKEPTRQKIMGHQIGGMSGVYGNPLVGAEESAQIELVDFSEIDLGRYLREL